MQAIVADEIRNKCGAILVFRIVVFSPDGKAVGLSQPVCIAGFKRVQKSFPTPGPDFDYPWDEK